MRAFSGWWLTRTTHNSTTDDDAARAYEAYLVSAFAKPYILGYYKCQYRDAVLAGGQLKQGLRAVDGELRDNWARHLARIHKTLLATLAKQGRSCAMAHALTRLITLILPFFCEGRMMPLHAFPLAALLLALSRASRGTARCGCDATSETQHRLLPHRRL